MNNGWMGGPWVMGIIRSGGLALEGWSLRLYVWILSHGMVNSMLNHGWWYVEGIFEKLVRCWDF
jgi:hypothetical protein